MGIRFLCPNGHRLNVKSYLAGKRAICPDCGARVLVPEPADALPEVARQIGTVRTEVVAPPTTAAPDFSITDTASPSIVIAIAPTEVMLPPAPPQSSARAEDF